MNIGEKHREIVGVLIVFFLSALTFRNINGYHGDWQTLIDAAMGITEGAHIGVPSKIGCLVPTLSLACTPLDSQ